MSDAPTMRQVLIKQFRYALGELERPHEEDSIVFTVGETEFEYEQEILNEHVNRSYSGDH